MLPPALRWPCLTALALSWATALAAEPHQNSAADSADRTPPVLNLNVSTGGYPPYLIVSGDGEYGGIAFDVVSRIAKDLGYRVEPHEIPRKRVDSLLLDGHIDASPRAREWTENPDLFLFTDAIVPVREVFFTTAESDFHFDGLDSLKGVTLVTPLGYHYPQLEPLFNSGRVKRYEVPYDRDIFTFLLHGRNMDAGVADMLVGQWHIRQNNWQGKFRYSDQAISEYGYRLMLRPDWTSFAKAFNNRLAEMKANGELEAILDQYR